VLAVAAPRHTAVVRRGGFRCQRGAGWCANAGLACQTAGFHAGATIAIYAAWRRWPCTLLP